MGFWTSGLFWMIEGILLVLAMASLRVWAAERGIAMPWWKWILVLAWTVLLGGVLAFVGTNLGENEPEAALRGGLLFGFIALLAGVALWRVLGFSRKT